MLLILRTVVVVLLLLSLSPITFVMAKNSPPSIGDDEHGAGPKSLSSYLQQSCTESINKDSFEHSYCAGFIRATLAGFETITAALYPTRSAKCLHERTDTIKSIQWLNRLPSTVDLKRIARQYLRTTKEHGSAIPERQTFRTFLLGSDEEDMAASMASYKTSVINKGEANKHAAAAIAEPPRSKTSASLYRSCRTALSVPTEAHQEMSFDKTFCNATISGSWVGYALSHYDLPRYPSQGHCAAERDAIVLNFAKRYQNGPACEIVNRKANKDIARAYLESIDRQDAHGHFRYSN